MRVNREQAARNRERVVDTSARLFRSRGLDGIGIADLMRSSGLTHGAFYGQFESKDALAAECVRTTLERSIKRWSRIVADHPDNPVAALATDYLSDRHLNGVETGCALTTLASDAARRGGAVAEAMAEGMEGLTDILERALPEGGRARALAILSQMIGAMTMARSVNDPALATEILAAARRNITG
jgi:TetR/AcrR family transcriptional repressor of nem operon